MVTLEDVQRAAACLKGVVRHSDLIHSTGFSRMSGAEVYLKTENLQRTGSFKLRGAYNMILNLPEARRRAGVVAASAGNHAQGVALAASMLGTKSLVVMPETASLAKVVATRGYGAEVILQGANYDAAQEYAKVLQKERGLTYVPAFEDPYVIAGQGTIGLEILQDLPDVEIIVVPVGGGGLISGVAVAAKSLRPSVKVVGVESSGAASVLRSLSAGRPEKLDQMTTIADGIAVKKPGQMTFEIIQKYVDEVVTVEDEEICQTIVLLLERAKLVVEGAGAAALTAVLWRKVPAENRRVAAVLSGGNIDMNLLARIIQHGLTFAGRYLVLRTRLEDRPGQLVRFLRLLAEEGVNVLDVEHHRAGMLLPIGQAEVQLTLETRDLTHCAEVVDFLRVAGYETEQQAGPALPEPGS